MQQRAGIDFTTRDEAPLAGELVLRPGLGETRILCVLAHYPVMGRTGAWEVSVRGIRKLIKCLVVEHLRPDVTPGPGGRHWVELSGR